MADIAIELCTWDLLEGKAEGGQLVVQAEEVVEAPFHCCLLFPSVSPAWERAWSICGWLSQVTLSCWYSALILQPSSAMPFNFKGHLQLCALISPVGCTHFPLHPLLWHLIRSWTCCSWSQGRVIPFCLYSCILCKGSGCKVSWSNRSSA